MSPNLGKTTFDAEELAELRAKVLAILDAEGLTRRTVAVECDVPEGTFGPWLNGTYLNAGGTAKREQEVATAVNLWLRTRADRAALTARIIRDPDFQQTPTAQSYLTALDHAQFVGDMVLIAGAPGIGKTASIRQHRATRPRVFVATMDPSTAGVMTCLQEVLAALGKPDAKGTPYAMTRQVAERFAEPGALLVIDESHFLTLKAIEALRSIHDRTQVGLAFVGDQTLPALFGMDGRKVGYAQLASRFGYRARIRSRPTAADVEIIAKAWNLADAASVRLAQEIAAKPGALRGLTKVLRDASRMAAGVPTAGHIREAWTQQLPEAA